MPDAPKVYWASRPVKRICHGRQVARRRRSAHVLQHRSVCAFEAVFDNLLLDCVPLLDILVVLQM